MTLSLRAQKDRYSEDIIAYRLYIDLSGRSGEVNRLFHELMRATQRYGGKYFSTRQQHLPGYFQLSKILIVWFETHEELKEAMEQVRAEYGSRWYGVEIKTEDKGEDTLRVSRDVPYFPEPEVDIE